MFDEALKEFATARQGEYIDAVNRYGSNRKAAEALGIHRTTIDAAIASAKRAAALKGYAPECDITKRVPDPLVLKGTSTLYGKDGEMKLQWVKTKLDDDLWTAQVREFVEWLVKDATGVYKPAPCATPRLNSDLCSTYIFGDPHFGMYAWGRQTGGSYDLNIAERMHCEAMDRSVAGAPPSERALILNMGDFFHADNNTNMTPRSGNILDTDTRWERVMQIGLRAMVYMIMSALSKHQEVVVRNVKGNHDPHASFALALALDAFFRNEPRVIIDLSPVEYWYYRHGKVLIGATHSAKCKIEKLPLIMAHDRPQDWGETTHRYFHGGHVHHDNLDEFPGCVVEQHRTLAAPDSFSHGAGYRSGRSMKHVVYHREHGEVERYICDMSMIEKASRRKP